MINLVLSGGGVRGFAHLGVIKFLNETGIKINHLSGTSSGAIVAAFIAGGYKPDECLKIFNEEKMLRRLRATMQAGFFKMDGLESFYLHYFPTNSFESLEKKLTVSATDIVNAKTIYFSSGELIRPLLAATSIPVIFKPIQFKNLTLLDGGLLNNLPVEPLLEDKLPIIGVHVNPVAVVEELPNTLRVMERCFNLAVYTNVKERIRLCDLVIEPAELKKFSVHQYSKAEEIFLIGYEYARSIRKQIEEVAGG